MKFFVSLDALFSASYAMPPVSAPSPMTEITYSSVPRRSLAATRPIPAEMEVELCPVSKQSQSLSFLLGKPLMPPYLRSPSKPDFLPVRSLWV